MPNSNTIVVARPIMPDDEVTPVMHAIAQHAIDYAVSMGYTVIDGNEEVVRDKLLSLLNEFDPLIYMFYGHGINIGNVGYDGKCVMCVAYASYLKGRFINAVTCSSSIDLDDAAIANGAVAYIGYRDVLSLILLGNYIAPGFADCFNKSIFSLLDGKSIREAYNDAIDEYNYWIDYYYDAGDSLSASILMHNRDVLTITGNANASLENPTAAPGIITPTILPLIGLLAITLVWSK